MKSTFLIQGLDCSAEEQVIRNRFSKAEEVKSVEFDLVNRVLTVHHEFDSDSPLRSMLAGIGLPPEDGCDVGCAPEERRLDSAKGALAISLVLAIAAEVVAYATGSERSILVLLLSIASIALGGSVTFKKGLVAVKTLTLNINFLMCIAVIGAFAIGSYPEAAMVTILFAIAEKIESYSLDRARNAVKALMELSPETAWVKDASGQWQEREAATVTVGEMVRVKPGERIPLDGVVASGQSSVNQAPITGESIPVDKGIGDSLFAGTINEQGVLEFEVSGTRGSTTLDRIIATVQEAQGTRAPTQRFVDNFARYYTPVVVVLALFVAFVPLAFAQPFVPWLYKALVLLVIACPCALVISTPVTVVSGLASAARQGILIKGGAHLEAGRTLNMIALDKTGTLTHGKPEVTDVVIIHDYSRERALQIAASLDHLSGHPVAKSITDQWSGSLLEVGDFESITGRGAAGTIEGETYIIVL
jgi:Cd2+/Zn2+-exporting ATPase